MEPSAALRRGAVPVLHLSSSKLEAITQLVTQIEQFCNQGYAPADIAVVYKYKTPKESSTFQILMEQLGREADDALLGDS